MNNDQLTMFTSHHQVLQLTDFLACQREETMSHFNF